VLEAGQTGALRFGVSELVVGLAVLAVGTSLPELAAGLRSALHGHDDISLGNVVGSNVFNVSAAIGIAALVRPLSAEAAAPGAADALDAAFAEALRFDFPAVVALSIVLVAVTYTPRSGRAKGVFLLALYAAYWGLRAAL
jgi:cation:H+ antiporter